MYNPYICPKKELSIEKDVAIKVVVIIIIISMNSKKAIKLFLFDITLKIATINIKIWIK